MPIDFLLSIGGALENGGHRREALDVGRLSRRRYSCPEGRPWGWCKTGVSQVATGVVLGEPGFA
jgi:hypothetical protein